MSTAIRRTWRFALCAVLVGLVWSAAVASLVGHAPWREDFPESEGAALTLASVLAVLVPAWFLRRVLANLSFAETPVASVLGLFIGAMCFAAVEFMLVYAAGGFVEEVRMEATLWGKLLWSALCVLIESARGVAAAAQTAYLSLPLAWLSILLLRWATGGAIEPRAAPALSAA